MVAPLPATPTEPVMLNVGAVALAVKTTFTGPLVASLVTVIVADKEPAAVAKTWITTETVCPGVTVSGSEGGCTKEKEELFAPLIETAVTVTF